MNDSLCMMFVLKWTMWAAVRPHMCFLGDGRLVLCYRVHDRHHRWVQQQPGSLHFDLQAFELLMAACWIWQAGNPSTEAATVIQGLMCVTCVLVNGCFILD